MAKKPTADNKTKPAKAKENPQGKPDAEADVKTDPKADLKQDPKADAKTDSEANAKSTAAAKSSAKDTKAVADSGPVHKVKGARATGIREELEELEEVGAFRLWLRAAVRQTPSWLVSMVFHMIILLVLAMLSLPEGITDDLRQLVVAPGEDQLDDLEELEDEPLEDLNLEVSTTTVPITSEVEPEDPDISPVDDMDAAAVSVELSEFGLEHAPKNDLLATVGAYTGSGLSGRGRAARKGLVGKYGGTAQSEKAVAAALKWLAEHQFPNGSWSFAHHMAPRCHGQCRNPGTLDKALNAATAMALLPFLGAGQTHKTGKYKTTVKSGLYFLVNQMKISPKGGSLFESGGSMYSHGLASIVLCEAYAMTKDKGLYVPAQQALNFICYAQDPVGGGWRYQPRQAGDTSVVGWQIMALKSGHMAYLQVPPLVVKKAFTFLDTVQSKSGAAYGYTTPGAGQATTAIGLLCRMYLGWKKDNPALNRGAEFISATGPSKSNMYYNYYATQVMRHWEGDMWKKWNAEMRDYLVKSQATKGHEEGSWFTGGRGDRGGRLYCTSMATMILEVYYRHMPIYRKQSTEEDFPLE